jgi:hypothetical protein
MVSKISFIREGMMEKKGHVIVAKKQRKGIPAL